MRHDRHFVDELTQRMGEGIGRMIPISSISSNTDQPRTNLGDLDDLVASIAKHGILEPLLVRKSGRGYELVSGERRFHAAVRVGLTEVPCVELSVSDGHALEIALIENLQRKDLSAFEEAEGYRTLIEKYDYTHAQVAGGGRAVTRDGDRGTEGAEHPGGDS
jgi:ParB family chromosome partitioning protein